MGTGLWLVICGTEPGSGAFRIEEGRHTIGRGADCDMHLWDPKVSRHHAELVNENGKLSIRDLGSLHGTFVDGKPVQSATIKVGSSLRIGRVTLDVVDHLRDRSLSECDAEETERSPAHEPGNAALRASHFPPARKQVLLLLLQGCAEKKIGPQLGKSDSSVHRHVKKIYKTFGVHSRAELSAQFRNGETIAVI